MNRYKGIMEILFMQKDRGGYVQKHKKRWNRTRRILMNRIETDIHYAVYILRRILFFLIVDST